MEYSEMREREQKLRDRVRRAEDTIKDVQARRATDPSPGLKEREENLTSALEKAKTEVEERRAELGERVRKREVDFEEGASFRDVVGTDRRISTVSHANSIRDRGLHRCSSRANWAAGAALRVPDIFALAARGSTSPAT